MAVRIHRKQRSLTETEFVKLTEIAQHYYPDVLKIRARIEEHINDGAHLIVAERNGDCVGYSLSSCESTLTPFHPKKIPLIYQRQMFVSPECRGQQIGIHLQICVLRHHLGPFWLFRRFALVSITHNPEIVADFRYYSKWYPQDGSAAIPLDIVKFGESLLSLIGGVRVDDELRIFGTYKDILNGIDYTYWWKNYLKCEDDEANQRVLRLLYRCDKNKVIHSGASLMMLGYSKPLNFLARYLVALVSCLRLIPRK